MITECMCGHYREEHRSSGDDCEHCDCLKYRAGREVDLRAQVARLEGELADARRHWKRCEQGWNKVILQAEGFQREEAAMAAALTERWDAWAGGMPSLDAPTEVWFLYTELAKVLRADALSSEGKGWLSPEVREQARGVIEELFSLADRIPAEVRQRAEIALAALKGE